MSPRSWLDSQLATIVRISALQIILPSWDPGPPPAARPLEQLADYFSASTRLVWVVEPETRVVYAYRSLHDVQVIGDDGELDGGDVLPGFRCPVRRLFP